MPQPISRVNRNATIHIANNQDNPSDHRPQLALLAMKVVSEWSILESFFSSLFVQMLGTNPAPAAAIYASLVGSATQKAALRALAERSLSPEENDVFEAILSLFTTASKARNKIAHWVWGHAPEIPDGVLLCDPQALMGFYVELSIYSAARNAALPKPPVDDIFVFYAEDFNEMSQQIQRLMNLVSSLRFVLRRDHPTNADGELFRQLSAEPEVHTFLDRLHERRRIAQEVRQ